MRRLPIVDPDGPYHALVLRHAARTSFRSPRPQRSVVARSGAPLASADLVSFAAARPAGDTRIRAVAVVETIPRSPAGQVLRQALGRQDRGGDAGATA